MDKSSGAAWMLAAAVTIFAMSGSASARECPVLSRCAGMELVQSAAPDDGDAPDGNSATPPSDENPGSGLGDDRAQGPNDNGTDEDGGENSDQASPPDAAQPPGCIYEDRPLELLV